MPKKLRSGITTGTCAAAAAQGAILACLGKNISAVTVYSPQGQAIEVPLYSSSACETGGKATVLKDAGDDPDITHGTQIQAEVTVNTTGHITLKGGQGVGTVTKPGLAVPPGQPAINPGPRAMITAAAQAVLPEGYGADITIVIPEGEVLAKRTLNETLGIVGGLSVIGTTGIVEPMSEEAFKSSLAPQLHIIAAQGYKQAVFVPGKIGQNIAEQFGLPPALLVQTSNFVGYMLERAAEAGFKEILLLGHLGKLAKVAAGVFHTHNRVADARLETIAAYAAAAGASQAAVQEILQCTTTEAAMPVLTDHGLQEVYSVIAARASARAERYVFGDLKVGTAIVTLQGQLLGFDAKAREIGGGLGWNIK